MDKKINCSNGGNLGSFKDFCWILSHSAMCLLEVQLTAKLLLSLTGQVHGNVKKVASHSALPLRGTSKETLLYQKEL